MVPLLSEPDLYAASYSASLVPEEGRVKVGVQVRKPASVNSLSEARTNQVSWWRSRAIISLPASALASRLSGVSPSGMRPTRCPRPAA